MNISTFFHFIIYYGININYWGLKIKPSMQSGNKQESSVLCVTLI